MGQYEQWVFMKGKELRWHGENDGYAFLRHGAETKEKPTTLYELRQFPGLLKEAADVMNESGVDFWMRLALELQTLEPRK